MFQKMSDLEIVSQDFKEKSPPNMFGLIENWGGLIEGLSSCSELNTISDEIRSIITRLKVIENCSLYENLKAILSTFMDKEVDYINSSLLDHLIEVTGVPLSGAEGPAKSCKMFFERACKKSTKVAIFLYTKILVPNLEINLKTSLEHIPINNTSIEKITKAKQIFCKMSDGVDAACKVNNVQLFEFLYPKLVYFRNKISENLSYISLENYVYNYIHIAIENHSLDILHYIDSTIQKIEDFDRDDKFAFITNCIRYGDISTLTFLLYEKGIFEFLNIPIIEYLKEAIRKQRSNLVDFFIEKGIDINTPIKDYITFSNWNILQNDIDEEPPSDSLIGLAFKKCNIEIFQKLLDKGAVRDLTVIYGFFRNNIKSKNTLREIDFIRAILSCSLTCFGSPVTAEKILSEHLPTLQLDMFKMLYECAAEKNTLILLDHATSFKRTDIASFLYTKVDESMYTLQLLKYVCREPKKDMFMYLYEKLRRDIKCNVVDEIYTELVKYPHEYTIFYFTQLLGQFKGFFAGKHTSNYYIDLLLPRILTNAEIFETHFPILLFLLNLGPKPSCYIIHNDLLPVIFDGGYYKLFQKLLPFLSVENQIGFFLRVARDKPHFLKEFANVLSCEVIKNAISFKSPNPLTEEQKAFLSEYLTKRTSDTVGKHSLEIQDEQHSKRQKLNEDLQTDMEM